MNELCKSLLISMNLKDVVNSMKILICFEKYQECIIIGTTCEKIFPFSLEIKENLAFCYIKTGKNRNAYDLYTKMLDCRHLSEQRANEILYKKNFLIDKISDSYQAYNIDNVKSVIPNNTHIPYITFSITTCKRFELFEKTINSFLECCLDKNLISEWICVDDNSTEYDREQMREKYPFFKFIHKDISGKGHPQSMNIIREIVNTPYLFHMEDDFLFFEKRNYLSECLEVINSDNFIGQCLINKNYAEISSGIEIKGGEFKTTEQGLRYYVHEYCSNESQKCLWYQKHGNSPHCNYWPHFSFRPSLIKTDVFKVIGMFNSNAPHFEMEYAYRYAQKGYISAFLEGIYCLHTGRLTSQKDDPTKINAYILNNEEQFTKTVRIKEDFKIENYVINLDRRPDRLESFLKNAPINFKRFSAIDGKKLKPSRQLQKLFENNDYNMRKGMVGCALSHIKLWIQLLNSDKDAYLIVEDDIEFLPEFTQRLDKVISSLKSINEIELIYVGHHLRQNFLAGCYDSGDITIEKWSSEDSLRKSLGGTGGYIITRKGAEKLLERINKTGMTNGIDTVQQKAADDINVYYCFPHLYKSECVRDNVIPDTDIQTDYDSLTLSLEKRLYLEMEYYNNKKICFYLALNIEHLKRLLENNQDDVICYQNYENPIQVQELYLKFDNRRKYMLDDCVIFFVPDTCEVMDRLKVNETWNIDSIFENNYLP